MARHHRSALGALDDPDIATAYKTFSTKAREGDQFHDSLFAAFPVVQQTFTACGDMFTSTKLDDSVLSLLSPAGFGRTLMTRLSTGDLAMAGFTRKYERVAARVKTVSENIDFQKQLDALSPVPELLVLEKVVARKAA